MSDSDSARIPRRSKKEDDPKMIGLWKIGRTIGKGSCGRVRIARHSKTGQYAAVKIVSKSSLFNSRSSVKNMDATNEYLLTSIEREIVIMKLIEHPNIMRLYDVWETSTDLYLILEYVEGGELFEYLCDKGRLPTSEALDYFQQIIAAVHYCHRFNVAHRDLKPENILLDKDKNVKVADFGMAAWQGKSNMLRTACGSPHYAAPEVIMGRAYNGASADIWSCGIILYALVAGRLPFDDEDFETLLGKVKIGKYSVPENINPLAKDLITKMLQKDVSKRITMDGIRKHPFFLSQPLKSLNYDIPNLDEIARPLPSPQSIDPDILSNLRALWPDTPLGTITRNLVNDTPTWEKGVYHLLIRYRSNHLQDYDEEEENRLAAKRAARRKEKKKRAQIRILARAQADLADAINDIPPRTGPPTPRRASGSNRAGYDSSDCERTHTITPRKFSADPNNTPRTPIANIKSPDIQDAQIQHFFSQIVEHLNVMQGMSPSPLSTTAQSTPAHQHLSVDLGKPFSDIDGLPLDNTPLTRRPTLPLSIKRRNQDKENRSQDPSYLTTYPGQYGRGSEDEFTDIETPERKSSLRSGPRSTNNRHVQISEPPRILRKKHSRLNSESPMASSAFSVSDGGSFSLGGQTPKRTWFGNLFKFKPTSFQLVSYQDAYSTKAECRRVLENLGVSINASSVGLLRCSMEDTTVWGSRGGSGKGSAVKFRVEMHRPGPGYDYDTQVMLKFILEKGGMDKFRVIFQRFGVEWGLDRQPNVMLGEQELEDERFVEIVYASP
ncbi:hypothetical protein ABKN59_005915 [Abortiporus biennis]